MLRDYIELPLQVRILCLGALVNRTGSFVLIFLTIYASKQLGFGVAFATACMGVLGFGSMLGSVVGGQLADQFGRRSVMLTAIFGGAIMLLVIGSLENRWAFMLSLGAFAFISDMYRPAASAMVADLVPVDKRPHAFALMYISVNLGFAIAPPVGGILAGYSFTLLFIGDAATMFLFGLIILFAIRETRPVDAPESDEASAADGALESSGASEFIDQPSKAIPLSLALSHIVRDTPFLLLCFATLLIELVFMQGLTTLPLCIEQSGLTVREVGMLMSVNGILIFVLQLPMTQWLSRFPAMSVILAGGVLISIGFGLNFFSSQIWFFAITIAIWTLGEILQAPFKNAIVTDIAPADLRGRYLGLFGMCFAFAITIGAPAGGLILSEYGPQTLWTITFIVAICAIAVYLAIYRTISTRLEIAEQVSPSA